MSAQINHVLGVDIGGSHISAAVINLTTGEVVPNSYGEKKVNASLPVKGLLESWTSFLSDRLIWSREYEIIGIGIGVPGPFDYENGIALYDQNKFTQLYGINIKKHFQKQLNLSEDQEIKFLNDAAAFALGESWKGAAQGFDRVLMLTLGTGLGATFLQDDQVMTSGDGIPSNGTLYEKSFADSTADEYFSTRFFTLEYTKRTGQHISNAKEIADLAQKGDRIGVNIFQDFGKNLASFLKPYVRDAQTEMIVVGGNIALAFNLFKNQLDDGLSVLDINITPAQLGPLAPIIGAASFFRALDT